MDAAAGAATPTSLIDITKYLSLLPITEDEETQLTDEGRSKLLFPKLKHRVSKSTNNNTLGAEDPTKDMPRHQNGGGTFPKRIAKPFY